MPLREEFTRTSCHCQQCQAACKVMPGFLIPEDLVVLADAFNTTPAEFADQHLLASDGGAVMIAGEVRRVPTLTPGTKADGSCKFYEDGACVIHEYAPFGCAFFSVCQDDDSPTRQAAAAAQLALIAAWETNAEYAQIHIQLQRAGKQTTPLQERKGRLRTILQTIERRRRRRKRK